jgi:hypothetical protein
VRCLHISTHPRTLNNRVVPLRLQRLTSGAQDINAELGS